MVATSKGSGVTAGSEVQKKKELQLYFQESETVAETRRLESAAVLEGVKKG